MQDITIGQGETIRLSVTVEEDGAATAEFIAHNGSVNVLEYSANFDGLSADLSSTDTVIPIGSYDYYIKITWDDGTVDYLPDFSNCEGDCVFPQLIVCEIPEVS